MAAAALFAPALWYLLYTEAAVGGSPIDGLQQAADASIALTIVLGGIVVPSAFAFGTLLWGRYVPDEPSPGRGLLCGGATAYGCLLVVSLVISGIVVGFGASGWGTSVTGVVAAVLVLWALVTLFATLLAGWIVVPLGAAAGFYHELARRAESESAER